MTRIGEGENKADFSGLSVASVLSFSDPTERTSMRSVGFRREEGRMWVFIRPGVVRSANEEKVKLGREFCPIHRFDGNYQFLGSFEEAL